MMAAWFRHKVPVETAFRVSLDLALRDLQTRITKEGWPTRSAVTRLEPTIRVRNPALSAGENPPERTLGGFAADDVHPATDPELAAITATVCQWVGIAADRFAASIVDNIPSDARVQIHVMDDGGVAIALQEETREHPVQQCIGIAGAAVTAEWIDRLGRPPTPVELDVRLVTLGLASPAADAAMTSVNWSSMGFSGWRMARVGTLSPAEFGYVTARWDRLGGEVPASVLRKMRLDARSAFRQTRRYFARIDPDQTLLQCKELPSPGDSLATRLEQLHAYDPALVYAALRNWITQDEMLEGRFRDPLKALLDHPDLDLRTAANRLIGRLHLETGEAERLLRGGLRHANESVFLAAAAAATDHQISLEPFSRRLIDLLGVSLDDRFVTLELIRRSKVSHEMMVRAVAEMWWEAHQAEDSVYADQLWWTLDEIQSDPVLWLRQAWKGNRSFEQQISAAGRQQQRHREQSAAEWLGETNADDAEAAAGSDSHVGSESTVLETPKRRVTRDRLSDPDTNSLGGSRLL
ncbi:MAG: hypothetical protein AAF958_20270 [Planctomycetota bacterium]